jgi:hypothetical protein
MQIRPSILLGVLGILAASLALILWFSKQAGTTAAPLSETPQSVADTLERPVGPHAVRAPQPEPRSLENDGPIVFYGKLEDQFAQPVDEAEVIVTMTFHDGGARGTTRLSTRSDAQGRFKVEAGIGESVELLPRKAGYALASTNNVEFYAHLKSEPANPNNPIVLKMWKLQGAEPLATFSGRYELKADGTPMYFDFVTQTIVPTNGDIKFAIVREPGVGSPGERPDWGVEIEGVEGGLMAVTAGDWGTTFWAPVDGYQPKQVLRPSSSEPHQWSDTVSGSFFVQTRDGGVYTKLSLKVSPGLNPDDPAVLELSGISNTNGSCNWEGDPALKQE